MLMHCRRYHLLIIISSPLLLLAQIILALHSSDMLADNSALHPMQNIFDRPQILQNVENSNVSPKLTTCCLLWALSFWHFLFPYFRVLAVLQLLNKTTGDFDRNDTENIKDFMIFCGLVLQIGKVE